MHSWMNLVPAFQNNSKLFKICKKQTTFEKRVSMLSIDLGLVQVMILQRNPKQGSFVTFWITFTFKSKLVSIGSIFSDKFNFIDLWFKLTFFKFKEKNR